MENKIIFRNETVIDKVCWKEIYWSTVSARDKRSYVITVALLFLSMIITSSGFTLYLSGELNLWDVLLITLISAVVPFFYIYYDRPGRTAKQKVRNYREAFGKDSLHISYILMEDHLIYSCLEKQSRNEASYHQFDWMKETEHYFVIKERGVNSIFIFEKAGFVAGDVDAFRQFFQQYKYR